MHTMTLTTDEALLLDDLLLYASENFETDDDASHAAFLMACATLRLKMLGAVSPTAGSTAPPMTEMERLLATLTPQSRVH